MSDLKEQLKLQIIERLNLEDMEASDIVNDEPLFVEGLGLDSIDALELMILLEKEYGLKIADPKEARGIMHSIDSLAAFIEEHR